MKAQTAFLGMVLVVAAVSLGGCGPGEYRPAANEELYGIWTNGAMPQQKLVLASGEFKDFSLPTDVDPLNEGRQQIAAKWKDSAGNLWYKTYETVSSGLGGFKGTRRESLTRLSKSATVLETMVTPVREFAMDAFPSKLDSTSSSYGVYYRAEGSSSPLRVLQGDRFQTSDQPQSPRRLLLGDAWQ